MVEDVGTDADLALWALTRAGIQHVSMRVDTAGAYEDALNTFKPDVILCDYSMPSFSGKEALSTLIARHDPTPFIFLSGTISEDTALDSLKRGATDYILKSSPARLASAVERAVGESRLKKEHAETEGQLRTSLKRLDEASRFDAVTSLSTRITFCERLERLLQNVPDGNKVVVAAMDIERFHILNDALGWAAGNAILDQVAHRLMGMLGSRDTICRMGGDVFAFYCLAPSVEAASERIYEKLSAMTVAPMEVAGNSLHISIRYGLTYFPESAMDAEVLLKNAEQALKQAKESAERYVFYSPVMHVHADELLNMENRLRVAVAEQQFILHYQPKYEMDGMTIAGFEALLRWDSPELGRVAPAQFIPLLEETGMIVEVGAWLIKKAQADWQAWHTRGLDPPRIAVNISAAQLKRKDFLSQFTPECAACLDIEITESLLMTELANHAERLGAIRDAGMGIEIDDFGTGYSSLSYIATLPVSGVKVDRSFVMNMTEADGPWKVVSAVIALAHSLNLKVTAEGVETRIQWELLRDLKCDVLQGYYFGRPVAADQAAAMLAGAPPSR